MKKKLVAQGLARRSESSSTSESLKSHEFLSSESINSEMGEYHQESSDDCKRFSRNGSQQGPNDQHFRFKKKATALEPFKTSEWGQCNYPESSNLLCQDECLLPCMDFTIQSALTFNERGSDLQSHSAAKQHQKGLFSSKRAKLAYETPKKHQTPMKNATLANSEPNMKFKTELCKNWEMTGRCNYGKKCQFAHGTSEIQAKGQLPEKYKLKLCKGFHTKGFCPYGSRCMFIHSQAQTQRYSYMESLRSFVNILSVGECLGDFPRLPVFKDIDVQGVLFGEKADCFQKEETKRKEESARAVYEMMRKGESEERRLVEYF